MTVRTGVSQLPYLRIGYAATTNLNSSRSVPLWTFGSRQQECLDFRWGKRWKNFLHAASSAPRAFSEGKTTATSFRNSETLMSTTASIDQPLEVDDSRQDFTQLCINIKTACGHTNACLPRVPKSTNQRSSQRANKTSGRSQPGSPLRQQNILISFHERGGGAPYRTSALMASATFWA